MSKTGRDPYLFRTERLSKLYTDGQVHALEDVSIRVRRGEYVAIMGPSGSGKSTLLNLLGALDKPTSGEVFFDGEPLSKVRNLDQLRSRKFGFVFQSFHLLPVLTVLENVQVPMFEGPRLSARRGYERPRNCWSWWAWAIAAGTCRRSSRWASGSEWQSPGRWPTIRSRCWPTSRREISTRSRLTGCLNCLSICTASRG